MGAARPAAGRSHLPLRTADAAPPGRLEFSFVAGLERIAAAEWDALYASDYPFIRHDYLAALETHRCVGGRSGWQPCHLIARDPTGALVGAAPLYLKQHSYGEFVFDFAWANASQQLGKPYYPKLVSAIPFVPSAGPRLGARDTAVRAALIEAIEGLLRGERLSSAHMLFAQETDAAAAAKAAWLLREDVQFQWFNRGDPDFTAFVARFTSDKRKKLLRERRRVAEAGIRFEVRPGDALSEAEWHDVYALYANTYEERGQAPYLTPEFLLDYGRRPGTPFRLILAYESRRLVAAALTLLGGDTLYGRHWGAAEHYHSLHFECCYYQGIELCLQLGLRRYDAGAQGEHKLARGFEPVLTRSLHRLAEPRLRHAVEDFLARERQLVAARREQLMQHTPYRLDPLAG